MIRLRHLNMASRFLARRFRKLHPYEVQAVLLNACNLRCVYCRCPDVQTTLLTTEQWRWIIRSLGRLGTLRIKFQGGEPTVRKDFRELCAEAREAGMITAVTTNGLEVAKRPDLLDYLDEVVFSLDSVTPEIHDRLRGRGTHSQVVRAIDIGRERGLRVYVNMVVCSETLCEMEGMLEFCERRGIRLNAQPVIFGRKYFDDTAQYLALTEAQVRAMHHRLATWKRQSRALMFSPSTYEKVARWADYDFLTKTCEGDSDCMAGKFYINIEANGDVLPCQYTANFVPKNIIQDGFEEALQHVQRHNCGDCSMAFLNERKAVFALRPAALLEVLRRG